MFESFGITDLLNSFMHDGVERVWYLEIIDELYIMKNTETKNWLKKYLIFYERIEFFLSIVK